jgi:adenylate kinase family enzyme
MKRIIVIGSSGAGKSIVSKQLGENLTIAVVHIDKIYWQPGWIEPLKDEWLARFNEVLRRESWIIDGNYGATLETRLAACDTTIFLDMPRLLCVWRIIWRTIIYRRETRPDMADGCRERFDWQFVMWVWNYPKRTKPRIERLLIEAENFKTVIRLTSREEIQGFFQSLKTDRLIPQ